jgi:hypothetical protein
MKKRTQKKPPRGKTSTTPKPEPPAAGETPARFPEVKGKVLEWVELDLRGDDDCYIEIGFQDQTALVFEILPYVGLNVRADYGDWKTHNWRAIKRWPPFTSE